MSILQFAFGNDPQAPKFPSAQFPARSGRLHRHARLRYDGRLVDQRGPRRKHASDEDIRAEREITRKYLQTDGREIHWDFIRALLASVADTVLIPLPGRAGLGSEARMNQPATMGGNWRWRYRAETLRPGTARRLRDLTLLYERL